ncbi:hypothetical protein NDU88_002586 [Pleurodeles waltl]|uniref:Uncharacterized protein n=1 Tax=Pleurodeles waltl TaxID=8319 RepID=A0AAV7SFK0_PLEWA|nr:hypothetical protein NDU88_002586 [Pleurodeles waltl]
MGLKRTCVTPHQIHLYILTARESARERKRERDHAALVCPDREGECVALERKRERDHVREELVSACPEAKVLASSTLWDFFF